ncbi:tyrosine--tRNA ligase [Candidatus Kaiserbacteria bacterium]|nr:tyrosine--tRNA ligase [Candidatus Kaiserbacteria bacterium]
MAKLSEILKSRGYVYQHSSEKLGEITDGTKRTVYLGVDPTADSIHVGNLVVYMLLRRFADAGHKIILIIGGGTALVGDPKPDVERSLTDVSIVAGRAAKLKSQAEKLLGGVEVTLVNNADWLTKLNLMEFLRDTGKHFTVNNLIKKDAISARMDSEEGISFTEFSYPLLQAYDFWHLFKEYKCDVQIGGSDQWGNIIAGVDLIRRKENASVFALSCPLVVDKASGKKFGKSEGNAVWLDAEKTSPYAFYQFWLNASDESVADYLKLFTLLSDMEIEAVMEMQKRDAKERHAQKTLAREVTTLVHGEEEATKAETVTQVLFGEASLDSLEETAVAVLKSSAPTHETQVGADIVDVLIGASLATSKREAKEFLKDKAVSLNGEVITDDKRKLAAEDFYNGTALLKRGKKNVCVLVLK